MRDLAGFQDVVSDLQLKNPQLDVHINRDQASALNVSVARAQDGLYYAYGSRQISAIFSPTNEYQVIMELLPMDQRDPSQLSMLYVHSQNGQLIPLNAVASATNSLGPLSVNHFGQLPSVTVSFNLKPGTSIGDAISALTEVAGQTIPTDISTSFQGQAQAFKSSFASMGVLLIVAILVIYVIYMVLGILYESFIHPLTILLPCPLRVLGRWQLFGFSALS